MSKKPDKTVIFSPERPQIVPTIRNNAFAADAGSGAQTATQIVVPIENERDKTRRISEG